MGFASFRAPVSRNGEKSCQEPLFRAVLLETVPETSDPPDGLNGTVRTMKEVALSEVEDDVSKYLRLAESEEIVITRHGKPAGVLVGFGSEDDWFDYRLEHDPRFLRRMERTRQSLRKGKGVRIEDLAR